MPSFRTYGQLDDAHSQDGDRGFTRFVTRRRGILLQPSELAWSQNGRMRQDGTWSVRQGTEVFSEAIGFGDSLRLEFALDDSGTPPALTDDVINGVYGSCRFSDPVTEEEYILLFTNAYAILKSLERRVDGEPVFYKLPYPGDTAEFDVEPIQLLDRVRLFRGVDAATWEWDGVIPSIQIDTADRLADVITVTTLTDHGLTSGDYVYIQGIDTVTDATYQVTVTDTDEFEFANVGQDGGLAIEPYEYNVATGFVPVASGSYTQPVVYYGSNNTVVSAGLATVTQTAHGLETGDRLQIVHPSTSAGNAGYVAGTTYEIVVTGANTFTYRVAATNGTYHIGYTKRQPVSGGYIYQPNAGWGIAFQGRLIVPYTVNNNDELLFSDIFDPDTFDPIFNQFRPANGSADFLVGVQPWVDDRLVVLNRRSVHVIRGLSGDLSDASVREITRDVGCVARRTAVAVGDNIMWLSDTGVQMVNTTTEYNQLAVAMPLSEPIQSVFDSINWQAADKSVAAYHDNRYYLAVPVEGGEMPNVVLVYNFLNQGWESIDTFDVSGIAISNLFTARYRNKLRLFFVTEKGAVHLYEELSAQDQLSVDGGETNSYAIKGLMRTRDLFMGGEQTKRFNRIQVQSRAAAIDQVTAHLTMPTSDVVLLATPYNTNEDGGVTRLRVLARGYSMSVSLAVDYGTVESVIGEAVVSERSDKEQ